MAFSFGKRRKKEIFVVSGLPRSGTSLAMKMLQAAGFELLIDNIRSADEFNPKGYFEFEPIKNLKTGDGAWIKKATGKVVKVVSPLIQYLPKGYPYNVIFMERDLSEVLVSQAKMMNGLQKEGSTEQNALMEKAFQDHLTNIKAWLASQKNFQVLYLSYNQLFSHTEANLTQLANFIKKPNAVSKMRQVIDPNLYRNRKAQQKIADNRFQESLQS